VGVPIYRKALVALKVFARIMPTKWLVWWLAVGLGIGCALYMGDGKLLGDYIPTCAYCYSEEEMGFFTWKCSHCGERNQNLQNLKKINLKRKRHLSQCEECRLAAENLEKRARERKEQKRND